MSLLLNKQGKSKGARFELPGVRRYRKIFLKEEGFSRHNLKKNNNINTSVLMSLLRPWFSNVINGKY